MTVPRLVVVGASLAGLRAVESARRAGFDGEVVLVGAEPHLPYDRPPLSKAALAPGPAPAEEPLKGRADLDALDVSRLLGAPATGLDVARHRVVVGADALTYDAVVVATGSVPRRPSWWPGSVSGVHALRTREDARAVRSALDLGARVVVVGAGFVGAEVASAARARGLDVTLLEAAPSPLVRALGPVVGARCARLHADHGVRLECDAAVTGLRTTGGPDRPRVTGVETATTLHPADLVVVGVGADPATGWLAGSGLRRHPDGGLVCGSDLSTSDPAVWAAGDVAHAPLPLLDGESVRTEHWTNAAEQGALAGANAVAAWTGAEPRPLDTVPYFWSDWYGHRVQLVGSARADAVVLLDEPDPERPVALYRRGDRVVGALTLDRPRDIMKLRRHVVARTPWDRALAEVRDRVDTVSH